MRAVDTNVLVRLLVRDDPDLGLSDHLILEIARNAGHLPLGTFGRMPGRSEGAERLKH